MTATVIPVVWVSYHAPTIIPRGYWDQALIEGLMDGTVWDPPAGYRFEHLIHTPDNPGPEHPELIPSAIARARDLASGAVFVVPGQHHATRLDVSRLLDDMGRLDWALPIITGDEAGTFPVDRLEWPWVMIDRPYPKAGWNLGAGFAPHTRPNLEALGYQEATVDVSFAGQANHPRRKACVDAVMRWDPHGDSSILRPSAGFTQGLDPLAYADLMSQTRIAPCPSGPHTPYSFRLYEALEAGALPIGDLASPRGGPIPNYWVDLFGTPVPFPTIDNWAHLPAMLPEFLDGWKAKANRAAAWWTLEKRRIAHGFHGAIEGRGAPDRQTSCDCDRITVLVTTSPIPSHPSTDMIAETIESVRLHFPRAEIIVAADGVRPEQEAFRDDYEEYQRRLIWDAQHRWNNVAVMRSEDFAHQANLTRAALELVDTDAVLFMEHDTPLLARDVDWTGIIDAVVQHRADMVRLSITEVIPEAWDHLMVGTPEPMVEGGPLGLRSVQWSQRPHVARTAYYRGVMAAHFPLSCSTLIEPRMHGIAQRQGWEHNRIWLYHPSDDPVGIMRSGHTDGRAGEPDFPMVFGR